MGHLTQTYSTLVDNLGEQMAAFHAEGQWNNRWADLSAFAGKTVSQYQLITDSSSPAGTYAIYYGDIAIVSSNGSVISIYDGQQGASFPNVYTTGQTSISAVEQSSDLTGDAEQPMEVTAFYHGDQIGSARLVTAAGGWPISTDTFFPFGEELAPPSDPNHYKFTGKERDPESGNDYFGARFYSSSWGRFMSPDWSAREEPVPYAKLDNPQSLNLYSYVRNNPLSWRDADGHYGGCSDTPELCASIRDAIHGGGDSGEVLQAGQQALKPLSAASEQAILNSPLTGEQAVAFENATTSAAQRALVDPNILVGLGSKESNIDPTLVTSSSARPARGIFQITPGQQTFLKLTNDQVFSVTGAVPAVAGYFANYTKLFSDRKGADVGGDLAIASWTMGVQHTLNVFNKGGMPAVRATSLGDPQNHKVGSDYIDVIDGFQ
jgi:RHS repeat-associated protein